MTRRRWIADEVSGNRAALVGAHAQHLAQVLRGRVGQEFDIATGDSVRRGRITSITDDRVEFELGEVIPAAPAPNLTVVLSIFKFDRMEWAIEKCVELGVSSNRSGHCAAHRGPSRQSRSRSGWSDGSASPCRLRSSRGGPPLRKSCSLQLSAAVTDVSPARASCWLNPKNR